MSHEPEHQTQCCGGGILLAELADDVSSFARVRLHGWLARCAILLFGLAPAAGWAQGFTIEVDPVLSVTARARANSSEGNLILNEAVGGWKGKVIISSAATGDGTPAVGTLINVVNINLTGTTGDLFRDIAHQCEAQAILAMRSPEIWRLWLRIDLIGGASYVFNETNGWMALTLGTAGPLRCILIRKSTPGTAPVMAPAGDPATESVPEPALESAEQPDGGD